VFSLIGAALGTLAVQRLDPTALKRAIPAVLIFVALIVLFRPQMGNTDAPLRVPRLWFDVLFGLGIGFYDGFFGPGTGTFWAMAYVMFLGFHLTKATGYSKVVNLTNEESEPWPVDARCRSAARGKLRSLCGPDTRHFQR
jgi:uncharacterized membrane protein YfcA